ncbi:exodeoxyribonuclease VII small subunit [bacterium BMS3Bbin06]|nr:exodeoxyribonuclease VII small subunit [bacterium BMS3Abin08]GBE34531.1 exodeoxyribonuclease VII small subunit [bacterium BMS3Bbin06]
MRNSKNLTYAKALSELEQIIQEIESETIDVDLFAGKVKRAAQLIKFCKTSLRTTKEEVNKVLSEIEEKPGEEEEDPPGA